MKHLAPRHCCSRRKKATFTLCEQNWRIETWFWTTPRQSHTVRDHVDKLNYVFSLDTFELTDHGLGERLSLVPCTHKKKISRRWNVSTANRVFLSLSAEPSSGGAFDIDVKSTTRTIARHLSRPQSAWLSASTFIAHCRELDVIHHRHRG